jgi:hypothetical protein
MWTRFQEQQQRGAQMPKRRAGAAPGEAVAGREAQDHEHAALDVAGEQAGPGESPASPLENREQDITPTVPQPRTSWDEVIQPERAIREETPARDRPLPEDQ